MQMCEKTNSYFRVIVRYIPYKPGVLITYCVQPVLSNYKGIDVELLAKLKKFMPKSVLTGAFGPLNLHLYIYGYQAVEKIWTTKYKVESVMKRIFKILDECRE